ncbi:MULTISPECIES: META domain-containing protein [Epilithonimonas]|uniref:Heat shock protein HslJ n=1 Tax=Epilithonimonas hungarica TaxID=454006 RepID=A0A1G7NFL9_9FLAO|nr:MULTISPECIES: META domain-containing protein [Epilithonimonas]MDP9954512.1 heat shock protein HslJ [Epilithonimonas hungarica]MPS72198.1 META domain-containing protein [Chryseobacterium sp.]MPT32524.1 META domain-containing protein [Chryseobacterium sp.]SDF72070.1 Heat shock protein HslJ [Epilithonimonas hungarica]
MKKLILISILSLSIVSCTSRLGNASKVGKNQAPITGTQWVLADDITNKPTLLIEQNRISGNAGCNNYFSEATIDTSAGNFSAKAIGSTRKMCNNMTTETSFLSVLPEVNKYVVTETTLELYKDNLLLLKFNKQQ